MAGDEDGEAFPPSGVFGGIILLILYNTLLFVVA